MRERIAAAARRSGREPGAVRLVAVGKTFPVDDLAVALRAGVADFGENRAQELVAKATDPVLAGARWHMIGGLQTNKVRALAPHVALWQSVDRDEVAREIGRRVPGAAVLVQVNIGSEPQKHGCEPADVERLVDLARAADLDVVGLMCVPPADDDPRPHFEALRALADHGGHRQCSMGMSGDYELAIEAGATIVRVGSAIFGGREPPRP